MIGDRTTYHLIVCILLFVSSSSLSYAQVVINSSTLPQIGDTLEIQTDLLPGKIAYHIKGKNQLWNFNKLAAPYVYQSVLAPAPKRLAVDQLAKANVLLQSQDGYGIFMRVSKKEWSILGYSNYDFMGVGGAKLSTFDKPYPIKQVPMRFGDTHNEQYRLSMVIPQESIPSDIQKELPYTPDSARYVLEIDRTDVIDAYGNVDMPADRYKVLRQVTVEKRQPKLEIKSESIPWQDVSPLFVGSNLFLPDSIKKVIFWGEKSIVPIAEILINPSTEEVSKVDFASHPFDNASIKLSSLSPDIFAYPNPTLGRLRFDLVNLVPGFYTLELINLLGVQVWQEKYYVNQNKTLREDFSDFRKGTYFYRLRNEAGNTVTTKRLIILKP